MPQLINEQNQDMERNYPQHLPHMNQASNAVLYGPPKPPRTAPGLERAGVINSNRNMNPSLDKAEIRTALQNWQKGVLLNDHDAAKSAMGYSMPTNAWGRSSGDGKPAIYGDPQANLYKKTGPRRREPRRHTLQNGIDYNMLKRIKQIEHEKDVLMQGLTAVERAREWYLKQVAIVQEKMKYLGRVGSHAVTKKNFLKLKSHLFIFFFNLTNSKNIFLQFTMKKKNAFEMHKILKPESQCSIF